ncbi:MAG TPA: glycogen synthase GlgA [Burkholderiales bacterium]|nr:glycogen synthase GlgA [Burkholderiales bacterium]
MGVAAGTRVLFVTAELAPWAKVGGLGEVARDLPRALAREGADVRTLVPAYPALKEAFPHASIIADVRSPGGAFPAARILEARDGVPLYLLECDALYARPGGLYQSASGEDWRDNHLRYGLLSRFAALVAAEPSPLGWQPQIVHGNDWQTGLAAAYLAYADRPCAPYLHTIHNIAYQGIFPPGVLADLALPPAAFSVHGLEFHGQLSFLKAGIRYAAAITTVSPTYAREIQTPQFGAGLDGLLRQRRTDLVGILNGIDPDTWNPASDPHIARTYSIDALEGKAVNKAALQRAVGLPERPDVPLIGMVGRLVEQKGIDLVLEAAEAIVASPAQLVVLGAGPQQFVEPLQRLAGGRPSEVAVRTGFDEPLAHLVEAGADMFLMPSRFEPCGLNQLYSMRYGTPPIVRRTGGLADSVVDCSERTLADGSATGFMFDAATAQALLETVRLALSVYREPAKWHRLQANGMARDFRWDASARRYLEVYSSVLARPRVAGARG